MAELRLIIPLTGLRTLRIRLPPLLRRLPGMASGHHTTR